MAIPHSILITGGTGYIGSHTATLLLLAGFDVVVLDNLINSTIKSLSSINQITGCRLRFIQGDLRDRALLAKIFSEIPISAVLHFAGLKSVADSISDPIEYFDNNVSGTITLCKEMARFGIHSLVFSSSATVYGNNASAPLQETATGKRPNSPYGQSKLIAEGILNQISKSNKNWNIAILRYFNPIGAHPSGLLGEDAPNPSDNLLPRIIQVAAGEAKELLIYGLDYPTGDGTGIRDYIHVMDIAEGHLMALKYANSRRGCFTWNLGSGKGCSVLEMVRSFEAVTGIAIPCRAAPRRPGDVAEYRCDPTKAQRELGWHAKRDVQAAIQDAWRWHLRRANSMTNGRGRHPA